MIVFVIVMIVLALVVQKRVMESSLDAIREDYWPEENVVEPGERFHLVISLDNTGRKHIPYVKVQEYFPKEIKLHLEKHEISKDMERGGNSVSRSAWLRPYEKIQFRIPISISERGQYVLPHPGIYGGDFLGLKERRRVFRHFREVVVAPKEVLDQEIGAVLGSFLGEQSVRRFLYEDPVLTVGYREYTGRDPMKMISWKQSARGSGLMVKKYDYTMEMMISVILNVDTGADKKEPLLERCFSLTRTVCRMLEDKGIPYDFCTNAAMAVSGGLSQDMENGAVSEGLGSYHFANVLECLGRAAYQTSCPFGKFMEKTVEKRDAKSGANRGKILITPGEEMLDETVCSRLKDSSGGSLLILKASEGLVKESKELAKESEKFAEKSEGLVKESEG